MLLVLDGISAYVFQGLRFDGLAGYVGGHWPDYSEECRLYPQLAAKHRIFGYAISASEDAEACDTEAGDLTVAQTGPWVDRQLARGVWRTIVYANLDTWRNGGLWDQQAHHGNKIRRIVADWTFQPGISIPGFDGQQWTDRYASRNIDGNSVLDSFFPSAPQPPATNGPHYERYPTGPFPTKRWGDLNEQQTVKDYDAARAGPAHATPGQVLHLRELEGRLAWLADRVRFVAMHLHPNADHSPSWGVDWRGYRYQQLVRRAQGHRFV